MKSSSSSSSSSSLSSFLSSSSSLILKLETPPKFILDGKLNSIVAEFFFVFNFFPLFLYFLIRTFLVILIGACCIVFFLLSSTSFFSFSISCKNWDLFWLISIGLYWVFRAYSIFILVPKVNSLVTWFKIGSTSSKVCFKFDSCLYTLSNSFTISLNWVAKDK